MVGYKQLTKTDYVQGVISQNRSVLARAITLVESIHVDHRDLADCVLTNLLPYAGKARRIGITGVPGVGKSTFIETLGKRLTSMGHRVAVLAVDPTSTRTGGSILGDKTRMQELARDPAAFIRPSPTSGTLGGVARATRESMVLCEAAGYDVILVETVGVGQSETTVAEMVDFFLALMLPGAGDELQGLKKGLIEIADMIVVNKADGVTKTAAKRAASEYMRALHILRPVSPNWTPSAYTCSALNGDGLEDIWRGIETHRSIFTDSGELVGKRREQRVRWMWSMIQDRLINIIENNQSIQKIANTLENEVMEDQITPGMAVAKIIAAINFE
ncbi:methylmalonyl Co-A mutase-associated GTPase MeaB [Rhodospirillaceae bacterium]|nr:methylmalonyl Co-A mutase-associated GTPase MeaB [Rhodospirillaceae bacterium]MBT5913906.1 methylmalonyl Co-A mutase-associated GTPase MeaB [Rhodospirillaceae bacterium]MBT6304699.1 methylmalonyl Co-A mutase-associated GTPase MeaB [Rhodospirillaceae bacterium]MDC0998690.1 methylmalonyl Co-A mutase-associated GTPase MeaB [Alphaproteobacteria bacterium]MDC1441879.1 methylmalonyl Co-A mutase-associated GTPase MeaB [Rhodospirillaceae bacterium]|tara:strand:+ start:137 stop:1129 length:993 start_codon:yes stop_codon:yes gene_type:complete